MKTQAAGYFLAVHKQIGINYNLIGSNMHLSWNFIKSKLVGDSRQMVELQHIDAAQPLVVPSGVKRSKIITRLKHPSIFY